MINIFPKNVFKGKDSSGNSFRIEEWDFTTLAGLELANSLIMLCVVVILSAFVSPFIFLLGIIHFNGRVIVPHIIGIIVGCYFLADCYNGWIGIAILNIFFSESSLNFIMALNITAIFGHLMFWLLGWEIHNQALKTKNYGLTILAMVAVIVIVGFRSSYKITDKHIGWVEKNVKDEVVKPVDQRTTEQIDYDSRKEYEDELRKEGRTQSQIDDMKNFAN